MSKEIDIRKECCDIWNNLKDKTKMIDCLIESKRQIADLETKLAEKEEAIKYLKNIKRYDIGEMLTENAQLKQQLAEKEAELVGRKKLCDLRYEQLKNSHQDKIEFAIAELEKVKETMAEKDKEMFSGYVIGIELRKCFMEFITQIIDQQIKEMNNGKDK